MPYDQRKWFDMYEVIDRVIDAGSFFEIKRLFAGEIIVGLARIGGRAVGIVANQPKVKGGVLMVDSSDKAARFIWLCNAYNIPLVYLADVSGFMVGTKVERAGIIRHGAKMVFATSQATVPKICVVVRKCYGAGLYAMCGPAFEPDAALALPQGQIAIMGPEPAVNAVYYNKIMELPESERAAYVRDKRDEYAKDVDVYKLASEMLVDGIVGGFELRDELIKRLAYAESKQLVVSAPPQPRPPRLRAHVIGWARWMASLVLAVRFLTIVPVPGREAGGPGALGRAAWWFPAIGLALGGGLMLADRVLAAVVPPLLSAGAGRGGLEGGHGRPSPRRARRLPRRAGRRECGAQAGDHARQPHRRLRRARARAVSLDCLRGPIGHSGRRPGPDPAACSGGRPTHPAARRAASFARPHPARASARRFSPRSPVPPGLCGSPSCSSSPGSCSGSRERRWWRARWSRGLGERSFSRGASAD